MKEEDIQIQQISGKDANKSYILSVIAKRTYDIVRNGKCILSAHQVPLSIELSNYEDEKHLILNDTDLYPFKPLTDVVIKGNVYGYSKSSKLLASIEINTYKSTFFIVGNRKAFLNTKSEIVFSEPELIDSIPLRYNYAYGGKDVLAEQNIQLPDPELTKYFPEGIDLLQHSLYRYKRNPAGKGFITNPTKQALELLEMPNIEDPDNVLKPDNIVVKNIEQWYKLPLPRCTDWVNPLWFPRIAYLGLYNILKKTVLPEIQKKWADPEILSIAPMKGNFNLRGTNGASLGLQLPYIKPGEIVRLTNMHSKFKDLVFQLPTEHPEIWIDGRKGKLLPTKPVMHTLLIEPDADKINIVWRGCGPAIRPYFEQELKNMPYKVDWKL